MRRKISRSELEFCTIYGYQIPIMLYLASDSTLFMIDFFFNSWILMMVVKLSIKLGYSILKEVKPHKACKPKFSLKICAKPRVVFCIYGIVWFNQNFFRLEFLLCQFSLKNLRKICEVAQNERAYLIYLGFSWRSL